ncbi:nucleoside ABC transporter ATP-binding protein [Anaerolinea thermolimosa]|nr:ABC transporter ATP-binding protein [Anaerolinea thermolimosa]GAP05415.1 nucleoside ABC transporter ATP-binding protein [Anaerolinea thermolimosa]
MFAVQMQGIVKRFGGLVANDGIDFELKVGEIHALLGENGAGKTTLMRILYGLYTPDEGEILIGGKPVRIHSPRDAIRAGIGMVTQHFTLVPTLTVAENITLGESGSLLDLQQIETKVEALSGRLGIPVKAGTPVGQLSVGEQQRVEILKALARHARVLILDEPTAVLVPQEVQALFEVLDRLRREGISVVFISHKLHEVMTVCDRVTVLRDGRAVGTVEKSQTTPSELARLMVGRETFGVHRQGERPSTGVLLRVEGLNVKSRKGAVGLHHLSFEVQAGEVLGVAGVSGNGQAELGEVLSGMLQPESGRIWVGTQEVTGASPAELTRAGVGRIPEDRHASLVGELSVADNLVLDQLEHFSRHGVLDRNAVRRNAERLIAEYQIKALPETPIRTLSGGNMQKVLLARSLSRNPLVVIASQPTRGLDVGATDYVRGRLLEQRARGAAVLLISEDLDEIFALADRIAVLFEGKLMGILNTREATVEQIGLMMAGTPLKRSSVKEADRG